LAAARQDLDAMKSAREHDAGRANGLAAELERLRAQAAEQTTARGKLEGELARRNGEREEQAKQNAAALANRNEQVEQLNRKLADADREAKARAAKLEEQAKELAAARSALAERRAAKSGTTDTDVAKLRGQTAEQVATKQALE